ncbi:MULTISPECIES: hypothetical protein [Oceanobacillus]|uniref:PXO1-76 n=1 Tax=Oceanobacillus kimchii TaxID=746691 RepID=A0ABQ5TQU9_9BACI|nr:hypothetical protein [Oceanobacillus kimchii]GLO68309.1 hypothetical protein MACH08_40930 [Oceanobacillus kimchii]
MSNIIFFAVLGVVMYVVIRISNNKPILPSFNKESNNEQAVKYKKNNPREKVKDIELEEEPDPFKEFLSEVKEIKHHMLRYKDNTFVMYTEVEPVNYFLLSQTEQESIDVTFETWLAQTNYNVQFYLQNRYVDLSEPIKKMQETMVNAENLHQNAITFGESMVENLLIWQHNSPIFETKRYLIFSHKINTAEITADNEEELEEKIVDKAFAELHRRVNAAKNQLSKARMEVQLLTNEGIADILYHAFNRRRAVKNRFKDFGDHEMLSSYVTADQDDVHIDLVKEAIRENEEEEKQREKSA